jgi:hypothetical protein
MELDPPTEAKLIMFELGYANEDIIYKRLLASATTEGYTILREEEIPIEWMTSNGTKVTGRPDMVLCRITDELSYETQGLVHEIGSPKGLYTEFRKVKPALLLELKSVHSVWVARDVLLNQTPKTANLAQAAHYMWKLGTPGKLIYRGYSNLGQGMADWGRKLFPRLGGAGSEYCEYNPKGEFKQLNPFEITFDVEFDAAGRVQYRVEGTENWTPTIMMVSDLERYFEFVSEMPTTKDLGPRPLAIKPDGGKLNYTDCDYCPLRETCDTTEKSGYDTWLVAVRKQLADNK